MKASFLLALVPCAVLAACGSANPPEAASDAATYGVDREGMAEQPAAGTGTDNFGNPLPSDDPAVQGVPLMPDTDADADRLNDGEFSSDAPGAGPTSGDQATDIVDETRTQDRQPQ